MLNNGVRWYPEINVDIFGDMHSELSIVESANLEGNKENDRNTASRKGGFYLMTANDNNASLQIMQNDAALYYG